MKQLFDGIRVLDFTNNYAGPMAGAMLADYGAEVIHIERPVLGDDNRFFPPIVDGTSINYCTANRGKQSVTLDLKDEKAVQIVRELVKNTDVILESFRPGVMSRLGLDYETLKKINPKVIYCSISAYGQKGPYAHKPGYDIIAQAVSGLMDVTGSSDGAPTKIGSAIGDWIGALNAFGCIGTALYAREKYGVGQQVDISLVRSLLWMAAKLDHKLTGEVTTRSGNHHTNLAPYGLFQGNNNESIVIGVLSHKLWKIFCTVIGKPELIDDKKFATNTDRVEHKEELITIIEKWLKGFDSMTVPLQMLDEAGVPCAKVYNMIDIDTDPHFNQCGWIVDMPTIESMSSFPKRRFPADPFDFSEFQPAYKRAEELGQSNYSVLEKIGLTRNQVDELEETWENAHKK